MEKLEAMTREEACQAIVAEVMADPMKNMRVVVAAVFAAEEVHEHLRGRPAALETVQKLLDRAFAGKGLDGEDA